MRVYGLILLVWLSLFPAFCGPGKNTVSMSSPPLKESVTPSRLTSIAGCLNEVRSGSGQVRPLRLEAMVTYVDEERRLAVLQDSSAAMAVYLPSNPMVLKPG